jgi:hypothetical protein
MTAPAIAPALAFELGFDVLPETVFDEAAQ